jgi:hypothetical protein
MASKLEKAMKIVQTWTGRQNSRTIKDKIMKQCNMTENGANNYYYQCLGKLPPKVRATAISR